MRPFISLKSPASEGFTLIEMLGVILIMTLLAAGAVSIVRGQDGSKNRKAGIDQVSAVLTLARTQAITRAQPVGLAIIPLQASLQETGDCKYCVVGLERNPDGSFEVAERLGKWRNLPEGVVWMPDDDGDLASVFNLERQTVALSVPDLGERDCDLIVFGRGGEIISPILPSGRAALGVVNGGWNGSSISFSGRDAGGEIIRETLVLRAATGRVRALR